MYVYKLDNFGPAGGTGYLSHNSEERARWCSMAWASVSETEKDRLMVAAFCVSDRMKRAKLLSISLLLEYQVER
jgi:hypothetical protein